VVVKASLVPVLAVVALLAAMMAQLSPSTQSRVSVRFRIVSDVAVTKYSIVALANYDGPLAVFVRDGILYVAYRDMSALGVSIVARADTGEVVKTCSLGADNYFVHIVAGRETAYALAYYRIPYDVWVDLKIVDLWSCEILATFGRVLMPPSRPGEYTFKYDMYADRLLLIYYTYNGTLNADVNYVALVDVATRDVKVVFFGVYYDYDSDWFDVVPLGLHVGPDYYYILVDVGYDIEMRVYDKNLERAISVVSWWGLYEEILTFWFGLSDVAVNARGVLVHRVAGESPRGYYLKLVMFDPLLSVAAEYSTDADGIPSEVLGVVAYRDIFVFHHGTAMYTARMTPVPYAFMLLPGTNLAVNTSIAGFAVPVGYELWSNNRVALFNPATGDLYLVDPPVVEHTITSTVTETATTSVTYTTTETVTDTATITSTVTVTDTVTEIVTDTVTVTSTVIFTTTVTKTTTITETVTETVTYTTTVTETKTETVTVTHTITMTVTTPVTYTVTETTTVLVTYTTTETVTETVTNTITETVVSTTTVTELVTTVVTELVTRTVIETITRTVTEVVTKTVPSQPLSPFLPLLLLVVVVAVVGLARASARASRHAISLGRATAFVKKKRASP
jgi:hypothetical protein